MDQGVDESNASSLSLEADLLILLSLLLLWGYQRRSVKYRLMRKVLAFGELMLNTHQVNQT
jgi:hypothetical protein